MACESGMCGVRLWAGWDGGVAHDVREGGVCVECARGRDGVVECRLWPRGGAGAPYAAVPHVPSLPLLAGAGQVGHRHRLPAVLDVSGEHIACVRVPVLRPCTCVRVPVCVCVCVRECVRECVCVLVCVLTHGGWCMGSARARFARRTWQWTTLAAHAGKALSPSHPRLTNRGPHLPCTSLPPLCPSATSSRPRRRCCWLCRRRSSTSGRASGSSGQASSSSSSRRGGVRAMTARPASRRPSTWWVRVGWVGRSHRPW